MNKNEWYQVGEDIKKQVQQAIDTNDFTELSKSIGETVGLAVGDVSKSLNDVSKGLNNIGKSINEAMSDAAGSFQQGMNHASVNMQRQQSKSTHIHVNAQKSDDKRQKWERYNGSVYYAKPNLRPDPKLFNNTPPGSVSGIVWMVLGFGTMGLACLSAVSGVMGVLVGAESVTTLSLPIAASVTAASTGGVLGAYGAKLKRREERFRRYVDIVKEKLYCSIEDIAGKTGRSKRYVRRDLKKMMQKGMFLQGHLDKKENCFIASDAMYEQYMLTQKQYDERALLESKEKAKNASEVTANEKQTESMQNVQAGKVLDEKAAKVLEEGREYIVMIRRCNDEIPGEEMSEKLDKLEMLVTRIFARVEENPEQAPDLQKMLN